MESFIGEGDSTDAEEVKKEFPEEGQRMKSNPTRRDWPLRERDKHAEERGAEEQLSGQTGGSLMVGGASWLLFISAKYAARPLADNTGRAGRQGRQRRVLPGRESKS